MLWIVRARINRSGMAIPQQDQYYPARIQPGKYCHQFIQHCQPFHESLRLALTPGVSIRIMPGSPDLPKHFLL